LSGKNIAELARDDIEAVRRKRQRQRVGLPPFDPPIAGLPLRRLIEHRLIEIGRNDACGLRKA
jgi:hypothetical protein